MDFAIGCSLAYTVNSPAALVFNLEAAHLPRQVIRSESLTAHPPIGAGTIHGAGERQPVHPLRRQPG